MTVRRWRGREPLAGHALDVERLAPGDPERLGGVAIELEREDAHPDQVRFMNVLEVLAMTARTPRSFVPLAAQSRDDPCPLIGAGDHVERHLVGLVLHRRVVD